MYGTKLLRSSVPTAFNWERGWRYSSYVINLILHYELEWQSGFL